MIHVDKNKCHIAGTEDDLLMEFGVVTAAMHEQFGQEAVVAAVATAIVFLDGKAEKVDMSGVFNMLGKLKIEGDDEDGDDGKER